MTDPLAVLECLDIIGQWYDARLAVAALGADEVQSYSIAGRTVTRKDLPGLRAEVEDLYAQIKGLLYNAGMVFVDNSQPRLGGRVNGGGDA